MNTIYDVENQSSEISLLVTGFEKLITHQQDTFEGNYLKAMLKYEGLDMKDTRIGAEGLGSRIKEAAIKVYEWVKGLLKGIYNFFTGNKNNKAAEELKETTKELKKDVVDLKSFVSAGPIPIPPTAKEEEKKDIAEANKAIEKLKENEAEVTEKDIKALDNEIYSYLNKTGKMVDDLTKTVDDLKDHECNDEIIDILLELTRKYAVEQSTLGKIKSNGVDTTEKYLNFIDKISESLTSFSKVYDESLKKITDIVNKLNEEFKKASTNTNSEDNKVTTKSKELTTSANTLKKMASDSKSIKDDIKKVDNTIKNSSTFKCYQAMKKGKKHKN